MSRDSFNLRFGADSNSRNGNRRPFGHQRHMSTKELAASQINPNGPPIELDDRFFSVVFGKSNISDMLTGRSPVFHRPPNSIFDPEEEQLSSVSDPDKCELGLNEFELEVNKLRKPYTSLKVPPTLSITPYVDKALSDPSPTENVVDDYSIGLLGERVLQIHVDETDEANTEEIEHLSSSLTTTGADPHLFVYEPRILKSVDPLTDEKDEQNQLAGITKLSVVNKYEIPRMERRTLNERKAADKVIDLVDSREYVRAKESFFKKFQTGLGFEKPTDYTKFSAQQISFYNKCLNFDETQLVVPTTDVESIKFIYIPSGGGKSTLKRISRFKQHYVDVDELIAEYYEEFEMFESLMNDRKDGSLMNKFFKYLVYINMYKLKSKFVLMNHPNQIPNVFRLGFNELIIIPIVPNWDLRFFNDNYISLLSVLDKTKVLSGYSSYEGVISRYFGLRLY